MLVTAVPLPEEVGAGGGGIFLVVPHETKKDSITIRLINLPTGKNRSEERSIKIFKER